MSNETSLFLQFLAAKTPEAWIAIIIGSIYVFYRSGADSKAGRAVESGISGLISIAMGPDIVSATGYPPVFVHFTIAVLGFAALDLATSIISDKKELGNMFKSFLRHWFMMDKGNGDNK